MIWRLKKFLFYKKNFEFLQLLECGEKLCEIRGLQGSAFFDFKSYSKYNVINKVVVKERSNKN